MKKVITYGTFDLFHEGHYKLLQRAKALGDYLIVGVTTESYDRQRGKLNVVDDLLTRVENVRKSGFADEIIIEECQFLKLNIDQEKELNQIFKTNFGNDQWDLINNLVDFLLKINCFVLIIFDQFKSDVINNNIYSKILKTLYNIKYVSILICISSNDKDFREKFIECLMKQPENNFSKIQNKFIYFDSLGNFKDYNDRSNEKINLIINYFGEIPKYRLIFNNLEDYNYPEQIDLIKIKIKKNLEKLYEKLIPNNQKNSGFFKEYMINCLFTLKKQINEKIKYKYLKDIL